MPKPCQLGHNCEWGRKQSTVIVCSMPRCTLVKVPKTSNLYRDRITGRKVTVAPKT